MQLGFKHYYETADNASVVKYQSVCKVVGPGFRNTFQQHWHNDCTNRYDRLLDHGHNIHTLTYILSDIDHIGLDIVNPKEEV